MNASNDPTQLLCEALAPHGVSDCRVLVAQDGFREGASVGNAFVVTHDERDAPVPLGVNGERRDLLISITDEGPVRMLAMARVTAGSEVLGIGIDLCSVDDFLEDDRGNHFSRLLFTDGENALIEAFEGPVPVRRAQAFASKEAAFKSTAAPLRRWYEGHEDELFFEAMDFELCEGNVMGGAARKRHGDRAQRACERMGIGRIEVRFAEYEGMVLCVAVALKENGGR